MPTVLLIPKRTKRSRGAHPNAIRVNTVVRRALRRAIRLSREQTLPRLASAIAHFGHVVIVHRVEILAVGVVVRT